MYTGSNKPDKKEVRDKLAELKQQYKDITNKELYRHKKQYKERLEDIKQADKEKYKKLYQEQKDKIMSKYREEYEKRREELRKEPKKEEEPIKKAEEKEIKTKMTEEEENLINTPNFKLKNEGYKTINILIKKAEKQGYKFTTKECKKYDKIPTEEEIINKISGGDKTIGELTNIKKNDKTKGSCASVVMAYIGNKAGYEVLDFKGGISLDLFAGNKTLENIAIMDNVKSLITEETDDFIAFRKMIKTMKPNKEYLLGIGEHCAMIKIQDKKLYYLELQSPIQNGWKPFANGASLSDYTLRFRFKAQHYHTVPSLLTGRHVNIKTKSVLIDAESLQKSVEFSKLLKYINTDEDKQQKGKDGKIR